MDLSEFDRFADDYPDLHRANVAITGELPEYFANYKVKVIRAIALSHGLDARRILDFGSGISSSIPAFRRCFPAASLTCADVSQRSLDLAALKYPRLGSSMRIEGSHIPAGNQVFDLSFSACAFHHIAHEEHSGWLSELCRVTRPGGLLSIFEHNPFTLHAVNTCPFDANARLLRAGRLVKLCLQAGWLRPRVRYHLFFPRAMAGLRPLEHRLSLIPFGAQYSVTAERP